MASPFKADRPAFWAPVNRHTRMDVGMSPAKEKSNGAGKASGKHATTDFTTQAANLHSLSAVQSPTTSFNAHASFHSDSGHDAAALLRIKMSDLRGRMERLRASNDEFLHDLRRGQSDSAPPPSGKPGVAPAQLHVPPAHRAPAPAPAHGRVVRETDPPSDGGLLDRRVLQAYDCESLRNLLARASTDGGETFAFDVLVPMLRFLKIAGLRYLIGPVGDTPELRNAAVAAVTSALECEDLAEVRSFLGQPKFSIEQLVGVPELFALCLAGRTRDPNGAYARTLLLCLQALIHRASQLGAEAIVDVCMVCQRIQHVGGECFHAPKDLMKLVEESNVVEHEGARLSWMPKPL